jgi:hypothetical protein
MRPGAVPFSPRALDTLGRLVDWRAVDADVFAAEAFVRD